MQEVEENTFWGGYNLVPRAIVEPLNDGSGYEIGGIV